MIGHFSQRLSARARLWVAFAAAILAIAVAVQLLVFPALRYRSGMAARHAAERVLAADLSVISRSWQVRDSYDVPIQTVVAETAIRFGLTVGRFLPGDGGALTVWLEEADPGVLYEWLSYLDERHGMGISAVALDMNVDAVALRASVSFIGRP